MVQLCITCTIYIHGKSHRKSFIDESRRQIQSSLTRDYKQQDYPLLLSDPSLKLYQNHTYFPLSNQFYIPDAETQIAQNLDTCVTAFNSLDSLLHELTHVHHFSFSKTTVAESFSFWIKTPRAACDKRLNHLIKTNSFGTLSFGFIALKSTFSTLNQKLIFLLPSPSAYQLKGYSNQLSPSIC